MSSSFLRVSDSAPHRAVATKFVSKLLGHSQASIIRCSDGALYVVKFQGISGRSGVLNELIGAELMQRMGLPSPDWALIEISELFLDSQPEEFVFTQENARVRPVVGLHFGSRLISSEEGGVTYQIIPSNWVERVENRTSFLGALVLDLWTNNCDRRQIIFRDWTMTGATLRAAFIDNDHMFGGPSRTEEFSIRRTIVPNLHFFKNLWTEAAVAQWMDVLNDIGNAEIERILAKVPKEWGEKSDREWVLSQLDRRRRKLMTYLRDAETALRIR